MSKYKLLLGTGVLLLVGFLVHFTMNSENTAGSRFIEFIGSEGLESIKLSKGENVVRLELDQNLKRWMVKSTDSPDLIADANKIVSLLDNVNDAKVLQNATKKAEHHERFEVNKEKASILEINSKNNKKTVLYFGKSKDYSSQFVRKEGDPTVYLISKNINLATDPKNWLHKKVKINKDELSSISYKTKDKKKVQLSYSSSEDKFQLNGNPPPKKQLKKLSNLADQFTEISFNTIQDRKTVKKTKLVTEHNLILDDKTQVSYKFLASKDKPQKYYLDMDVKKGNSELSPRISYLASLSKDYAFELPSINEYVFQKNKDDFFEELKEENKTKKDK